ncbi:hypothetical protein BDV96DRAFT_687792 [Lophiotrema nucula]|uniref:UBA domain-containing protein n=1 Tax=Lophiotrema nucula TaxID=690887 RepID=A0A6A5Z6J8_9PLEO|nr:hypothetical protein BDV96DRAFT_687792 [Lophiotrema nucula]
MADSGLEEGVMFLQSIGPDLSRQKCVDILKHYNNDVNTAVNKVMDGQYENEMKTDRWDGNVFHADRYGQTESGDTPSFVIDYATGVDNYPHSGAPSRPPSRTSHRSGTPAAHTGDVPLQSIENSQESGVIGNSRPVFGPATKDHYDTSKWAMVTTSSSAELIPDASPNDRKREDGQPAILKPLADGNFLPALLIILHSIPLYREALLASKISAQNYFVGDDWWKGNGSNPSRMLDYSAGTGPANDLEFLHEVQRLVAFLDSTDRAYGSVSHLMQLDAWKNFQWPSDANDHSDLLRFLLIWSSAYESQVADISLRGALKSVIIAGGEELESFVLDVPVVQSNSGTDLTLYDVLDGALFSSLAQNAHIGDISNVLIFSLAAAAPSATKLDCKIPATFYADRYLEENKDVIDGMFLEMQQYEKQIADIDAKIDNTKYRTSKRTGKRMEALDIMRISMRAFQPRPDDLVEDPRNETALQQLQSVYTAIERKLRVLDEEKTKIRKTLSTISDNFKAPIDDSTDSFMNTAQTDITTANGTSHERPLTHPYKLRGVSTRSGVFYILHPDTTSNISGAEQWWRMEYSTATSEAYIFREKVTLAQVLEKASSESNKALLVYANEEALSTRNGQSDTPGLLRQFIKQDNLKFLEELQSDYPGLDNVFDPDANIKPLGDWDVDEPPTYADDYAHHGGTSVFGNQWTADPSYGDISARDFHEQNSRSSDLSSATLTPNTEPDDEVLPDSGTEMREINGGIAAWAGGASDASSDTVGGEAMDVVDSQATINPRDIEMKDIDLSDPPADRETTVSHIELVDSETKKGG